MIRHVVALAMGIATVTAALADEIFMHQHGTGNLLLYNTASGTLSIVGDTGLDGFCALAAAPVPVPGPAGSFWPAGTIFGLDRDDGKLYVIDKTSAAVTLVGQDEEHLWNATGLAFRPDGTLYAVRDNDRDGEFYLVSTINGAATYLGYCDIEQLDGLTSFPVDMEIANVGLAHAGDFLGCTAGFLYHVDPVTFRARYVGDAFPSAHQTLDFSPQGVLYTHAGWYGDELYITTLNPVGNIFVAHVGEHVDGMAVIPEPAAMLLFALPLAVVSRRAGR